MRFGSAIDRLTTGKAEAINRPGRKPVTVRERANRRLLMTDGKFPFLPQMEDIFADDWQVIKKK